MTALKRSKTGTIKPQTVEELRRDIEGAQGILMQTSKRVERKAIFQPEFRDVLRYWIKADRKIALKAFDIIEAIMRDPFKGIGKPELLKYLAPGSWSRRLIREHRIVYVVSDDRIDFLQARYHY